MAKRNNTTHREVARVPVGTPPPQSAMASPTPSLREAYEVTFRWIGGGRTEERSFTITDNELHVQAYHWNYVVANRQRLNESAREELVKSGMDRLRELAKPGFWDEALDQMAQAGVVEVSIPFEQEDRGWSARVFPWEDVLNLLTKRRRDGKPMLVIRELTCVGRKLAAARAPKKAN